jgi:hypothetical protein
MAGRLGLLVPGVQELREDPGLPPALETAGYRMPRPIARWQIAPRCPGAQDPQHAIQETPMADRRSANLRFLGRKQWLQPLPWCMGQIASVHAL